MVRAFTQSDIDTTGFCAEISVSVFVSGSTNDPQTKR